MFRGLINDAKSAVGSLVVKYLARASVAIPFVLALGFAVAALTVMLVARFGPMIGYWIMAGGFTAIGIVAAIAVAVKEHEEEVAEAEAEASDTSFVASDAATQAALQAPLALATALLSSPIAPTTTLGAVRLLARNLPLVILIVVIGLLFWPSEEAAGETGAERDAMQPKPNGAGAHRDDFGAQV
jgi:hypothetical protein